MNFIEKLWGISPDAGSGTLEISLLVSVLVVAALVSLGWRNLLLNR